MLSRSSCYIYFRFLCAKFTDHVTACQNALQCLLRLLQKALLLVSNLPHFSMLEWRHLSSTCRIGCSLLMSEFLQTNTIMNKIIYLLGSFSSSQSWWWRKYKKREKKCFSFVPTARPTVVGAVNNPKLISPPTRKAHCNPKAYKGWVINSVIRFDVAGFNSQQFANYCCMYMCNTWLSLWCSCLNSTAICEFPDACTCSWLRCS